MGEIRDFLGEILEIFCEIRDFLGEIREFLGEILRFLRPQGKFAIFGFSRGFFGLNSPILGFFSSSSSRHLSLDVGQEKFGFFTDKIRIFNEF